MRIAVTGTHRAGKSTLIEELEERLPDYRVVDEPYHLLEEEGYEFASPPSLEDFLEQLRRSMDLLEEDERARNVLFDRSPLDFLGYLLTHEESDAFDLEEWLPRIRSVTQTLDLLVFVPIEAVDRIRLPAHEDSAMREAVDEKLAWILLDDPFELGVEVLAVQGPRATRVAQVLARLGHGTGTTSRR
ncbi:AAA family ATPase [Pyxidicoccus parkwayensis]|uniref:AAA family ATPase n=1 Tax=Pyxidicoccus parkwayensis TaxID=2813578 RepID=A0ABX7P769_9BACT|nr:AAA family ATPase [Pyxidicoccus parkwaysis]QSQ26313.1 AAA family ATPase [Pyxidicoccus parkwaysis]